MTVAWRIGGMRFSLSGTLDAWLAGHAPEYRVEGYDPAIAQRVAEQWRDIRQWSDREAPEWQAALEVALWHGLPVQWEAGGPGAANEARQWPALRRMLLNARARGWRLQHSA